MARRSDARSRVDRDGVRTSSTHVVKNRSLLVVSVILVAVVVAVGMLALRERAPSDTTSTDATAAATSGDDELTDAWASVKSVKATRSASSEARTKPADDSELPEIHARDVIPALVEAGEKGGIAAFPPPGTEPLKRGIVVPDDYELPEGYVRHYQATDDGKGLEPILMFSPDYEFHDQDGRPIALPEDRIVPPELAPPGLPLRTLDVPESGGATGR